ncbi:neuroblast differentiation-associated protein AHNAK-like, partial [Stegastes partitus]|uniref:Neuroblast differentiation-associated protein AHNAK-like n=1 Tax=Stegastes partitus TaxID=144197 RepID=A0A9Y4JX48_9TELE
MPSHRRGRSLSEALTLEQLDEGGVVISSINNGASSDQGLKEGDEILGATINFDQLSKEEVLEVLKLMEPFDDKIQVLTRNNLSKSLGNLDQYARDPETMLKDSYSKLYNAKVKRFMRGEEPNAEEGYVNGEVTGKPTIPGSSKVNLKHDTGLPRFGVDFGLLKSKTLSTDTDADSQFGARELTDGRNLNLPPFGLGLNGTSLNRAQESGLELDARSPQLKTPDFILSGRLPEDPNVSATAGMQLPNTDSPSVDLAMANLERPQIGLESNRTYKAPEIATNLKGLDVTTPKMGLNLDGGNITGPSLNTGVPQVSIEGTNHDFKMPKYKMPDLGLSGPHAQYSKRLKNPDLNVDDPSSYLESPNLVGVKTPDLSLKNPKVKGGISTPDINLPKASPQGPNLAADTPSVSIEGPSGKYKAPKFAMPKFDLPDIKVPSFNGELEGPNFKGAMAHPNVDVNVPSTDMNIKSPSGKLKIPGFGLSGSKVERPGYQLETPEMDVSALKGKGGINFPGVDLTDAKLNPNMPDVNMASSKFDIDANASSGKLKLPKFKLFGTLSKKKDVDVNAGITGPNLDLKSSDLDISGPNLSGGIKAPDINMPKIDLKAPKLDLNTQNVDLDMSSGKLKMPDVHAPDWDVSPRLGKVKMPKVNLSGTLPKGPNMDLNTDVNPPDWSLKAPKMKGGVNAPDFDLPNMDIKAPKLDVNTPNVNIGSPKAKLKFPKIKSP